MVSDYSTVIPISEISGSNILIFFGDMLLENQNEIGKYFMMGRHRNFHMVFLDQNYGKVNRQLIKSNLNCLVLFKQPKFILT